jgi:hypothetical protein
MNDTDAVNSLALPRVTLTPMCLKYMAHMTPAVITANFTSFTNTYMRLTVRVIALGISIPSIILEFRTS